MTIHKTTPLHRMRRVAAVGSEVAEREMETASKVAGPDYVKNPSLRPSAAIGKFGPNNISRTTLSDYVELPFLRWRLIAACMLAGVVVGLLALVVWPRSYESEAKLIITVGRESVGLDPTATTSPTLMLQKTQEEEVNSALEIMSSRQVAELVVDRLQIASILEGALPTSGDAQPNPGLLGQVKNGLGVLRSLVDQGLLGIGVKDPVSDRELAVRKVMNSVYIYAPKRSTAITIHAESKTPGMAQALASAMTQAFLDRHQSVNFNQGSLEFFEQQSQAVELELKQALAERSQFMQTSKVVSIEDQRRMLTDQMGASQRDVLVARSELEQALAEIVDLTAKAGDTIAEIVATKEEKSDETWSGMRQRVYELEIQEQSYASMYSDDNPKLQNARQQLEGARQILRDLDQERTNRMLTPNPVKLRIEEDLQRLQTKTVGLKSMLSETERQREELRQQIDELLSFELKLKDMDRKIGLLENSLGSLKSKLEEARVIDQLQADHISNVNIYQPATLVERPVSPKKSVVMAAFPMLGLMFGCGWAFLLELGNKTMRTPRQVETRTGRSMLASLAYQPKFQSDNLDLANVEKLLPADQAQAILTEILLATQSQSQASARCVTIGVLAADTGAGASTVATALSRAGSRDLGLRSVLINAQLHTDAMRLAQLSAEAERHAEGGWEDERLPLTRVTDDKQRQLLRFDGRGKSPLLSEFQAEHDVVFIDLPSAVRPDWLSLMTQHLDFILVVVQANKSQATTTNQLIRRLERNGVTVGLVVNKTRQYVPRALESLVG